MAGLSSRLLRSVLSNGMGAGGRLLLHLLGFSTAGVYFALAQVHDAARQNTTLLLLFGAAGGLYLCALYAVSNRPRDDSAPLTTPILGWSIVFQLILILVPSGSSVLSTDLQRYLWEGRVVAAGISPYRHPPESAALAPLQERFNSLWEKVEHKNVPAAYPPAALMFFAVLPAGEKPFKLCLLFFNCCSLLILRQWLKERRLSSGRLLVFAWLPLMLIELSYSAHLEALLLPFMLGGMRLAERAEGERAGEPGAARGRSLFGGAFIGGALLGAAFALKFVAVLPLWFQLRRRQQRLPLLLGFIGAALLCYLPLYFAEALSFSGLGRYLGHWEFNSPVYRLFRAVLPEELALPFIGPVQSARAACWGGAALLVLILTIRCKNALEAACYALVGVVLFSPTIYPWYLLWGLAFLPLIPINAALLLLSVTVLVSYEVLAHPTSWTLPMPFLIFEFLPPLLFLGRSVDLDTRAGAGAANG